MSLYLFTRVGNLNNDCLLIFLYIWYSKFFFGFRILDKNTEFLNLKITHFLHLFQAENQSIPFSFWLRQARQQYTTHLTFSSAGAVCQSLARRRNVNCESNGCRVELLRRLPAYCMGVHICVSWGKECLWARSKDWKECRCGCVFFEEGANVY